MQHYNSSADPISPISRAETFSHRGFRVPDPFAPRQRPGASFVNALLATTFFRCWHILIFFGAWSTLITVLNHQGHALVFQPTLLTVMGTVIGFVISYRTTSSFERYNEGRKLWSQIMHASRMLSRTIWFHVPDPVPEIGQSIQDVKSRAIIEKKSAIDLIEAFAVAVKHYLRGEDGIYYQDLYYLVKYLPAYALPAGLPSSMADLHQHPSLDSSSSSDHHHNPHPGNIPPNSNTTATTAGVHSNSNSPPKLTSLKTDLDETPEKYGLTTANSRSLGRTPSITIAAAPATMRHREHHTTTAEAQSPTLDQLLPPPVTISTPGRQQHTPSIGGGQGGLGSPRSPTRSMFGFKSPGGPGHVHKGERYILPRAEEQFLLPAHLPPKYSLFDLFPFSLLVKWLTKHGKEVKGKKAARVRAKLRQTAISHNLPLEISLYLSSYVAALQQRKLLDVPTANMLLGSVSQLVDALTGLERILTTPIPFSYSIHLWSVTLVYCLALPLQIWPTLKWVTIPSTVIATFVFFGFLVAGEEIENPFGYDKNDLNLDHFTQNIIRNELRAVTSTPPPDPSRWAFVPENDLLFSPALSDRITPGEWMAKGPSAMLRNLSEYQ